MMKTKMMAVLAICLLYTGANAQENRMWKRGYCGDVELSVKAAVQKNTYADFFTISTTHGYAFGDGAFIGAGMGVKLVERMDDYWYDIPLYLQADYHFTSRNVSPFVSFRSGVLFSGCDPNVNGTFNVFFHPAVGVDMGRFYVKAGYNLHSGHYTVYEKDPYRKSPGYYRLHQVEASFGIRF